MSSITKAYLLIDSMVLSSIESLFRCVVCLSVPARHAYMSMTRCAEAILCTGTHEMDASNGKITCFQFLI